MTVAYLVSDYGAASHTFVRREVGALRALGHRIETFSVQRADDQIGTESLLGRPITDYPEAFLWATFKRPGSLVSTWMLALRHRVGGMRSLLWAHFHFLEAILLAHLLNRKNSHHLHVHFANSGATVGMLAANILGIPWSLTLHGISETDPPAGALLAAKIESASFVACASYFMRAQAMRIVAPKLWTKMHIVRCGLDFSSLPQPKEISRKGASPRLVCVGRLSPEKGYHGLLRALDQLAGEGVDFELTIVGDGPSAAAVKTEVHDRGLTGRVRLAGSLSECATLNEIADADLLVLPSLMEGLPVVLMEAFALCRPVVASGVAGIPELVEDGENGWLFPPSDWDRLTDQLRRAIRHREKWRAMGLKGNSMVKADFAIESSASRMASLFNSR